MQSWRGSFVENNSQIKGKNDNSAFQRKLNHRIFSADFEARMGHVRRSLYTLTVCLIRFNQCRAIETQKSDTAMGVKSGCESGHRYPLLSSEFSLVHECITVKAMLLGGLHDKN